MNKIIKEDVTNICNEELPWEKLQGKKILITGASGFLGAYIVYTLLECNKRYHTDITVNALCRDKNMAFIKFHSYKEDEHLTLFFQDVSEEIDDNYASDMIIHTASPANPYVIQKNPYDVIKANVIGYDKLLKKAKQWKTQDIILLSSSAVYGGEISNGEVDENYRNKVDFVNSKNVYTLSKQMSEMMSNCFERENEIDIKEIRPFVIFGPGDDLSNHKGIIDFLNNCIRDENIIMKSNGEAVRSYVYISEAVKAFFYIILKGENGAYNIASEKNVYSMNQVAQFFCDCNPKISIQYTIDEAEYLKTTMQKMIGNTNKLRKLGWKDEMEMLEGIKRTILWGTEVLDDIEMR